MTTEIPYPSTGMLARLSLHIEQKLGVSTEELDMQQIVNMTKDLPSFCWVEIWRDFHRGSNLDKKCQAWLVSRIERHGHSHMEAQSMGLYKIVKNLLSKYD